MVRPVRLIALLAIVLSAVVALAAPGSASARLTPAGERLHVVVVDRISDATWAELAHRGAVGLLRPSYGPTTNRRRALAELVRGTEVNARLGGVPAGKPLINTNKAKVYPNCKLCIVVQLPPRGRPTSNDRLYRIAVLGNGFHGLLTSPTTHIPGLVSVVDIAPTDLPGHPRRRSRRHRRARDRPAVPARPRDRLEQSAQVPRPLHPRRECCSHWRCSACARRSRRSLLRCSSTSLSAWGRSRTRYCCAPRSPRERRSWRSSSRASAAASRRCSRCTAASSPCTPT